jgi:hypothetical protein
MVYTTKKFKLWFTFTNKRSMNVEHSDIEFLYKLFTLKSTPGISTCRQRILVLLEMQLGT